ncbi:response regulator [Arsenicibacter rosenii]|uniref:Response regulator n=1 Tax=Arsenicibacter rosenii TaxID=1750698 RepID=A0A1S2VKC5_9BACT|nr:response regulator [Arsenicibacter rosenii]OIN59183.1 response regulator [Arsenicibacter rosenii]
MAQQKMCFLVDDDIDDQEIFAMALHKVDPAIACIFANDGIDALTKLQQDQSFIPHYIFLDLNMPRMNGRQCLVELKKIDRLSQVPVIMYSTSSEQKDISETKALGATDYVAKPPSISILTQALTHIFAKY